MGVNSVPFAVNAELPDHVRSALPEAAQTRFRQVANGVLGDGGSAKDAVNKAWGVVKQDWGKNVAGWTRKSTSIEKAKPRTLYVCRYVTNAKDIISWAKEQGFKTVLKPDDLHVTIAFSKQPVDWMKFGEYSGPSNDGNGKLVVPAGGPRLVEPLGDKGAVVLLFANTQLGWRNKEIRDGGASWDFEGYQPHITITWDATGVDLKKVEPYMGVIELGPEVFTEVDNNWVDNITEKRVVDYSELLWKSTQLTKFNQFHADDGKFASGPGAGGAGHIISSIGGSAAKGHDWFASTASTLHSAVGGDRVQAISDKLHSSLATFHSVTAGVTKVATESLIGAGLGHVAAARIAAGVGVMLPFLSGVATSIAGAVAIAVLAHVAVAVGMRLPELYLSLRMVSAGAKIGKAEPQEISIDDMVLFQLKRLQAVLQDMDPSELAAQRAEVYLQAKDPELLKKVLNDLEDAGFTGYNETVANHAMDARVVKVDKGLGLVFGWAIICKKDGQDYYDLNIDQDGERVPEHIPEATMLEASADFMENSRVHKEMHEGDQQGTTVFAFPLTTEIAKAMGINTNTTGLLVAMKPSPAMLEKYANKTLTGFSIGGSRIKSRETVTA